MENPSRPVTGYPAPSQPPCGYPPPPQSSSSLHYRHQAPPPPPPPPSTQQPQSKRAIWLERLFRFAVVLSTCIATSLVINIIARPNHPSLSLSSLSLSPQPSATFNFSLLLLNPNRKYTAHYDSLQASLAYKSDVISLTALPPLTQPAKRSDVINGTVAVKESYLEEWAARGIESESGSVGFDFRVFATVKFKAGVWRTRRLVMFLCKGVMVKVDKNGNGEMIFPSARECHVSS